MKRQLMFGRPIYKHPNFNCPHAGEQPPREDNFDLCQNPIVLMKGWYEFQLRCPENHNDCPMALKYHKRLGDLEIMSKFLDNTVKQGKVLITPKYKQAILSKFNVPEKQWGYIEALLRVYGFFPVNPSGEEDVEKFGKEPNGQLYTNHRGEYPKEYNQAKIGTRGTSK